MYYRYDSNNNLIEATEIIYEPGCQIYDDHPYTIEDRCIGEKYFFRYNDENTLIEEVLYSKNWFAIYNL